MKKENKSFFEANCDVLNYGATYEDFPVGSKVQVVCLGQDYNFFYNETGVVIKNSGEYLGIIVKFDDPRKFSDGTVQVDFGFKPEDLIRLEELKLVKGYKLSKKKRMKFSNDNKNKPL